MNSRWGRIRAQLGQNAGFIGGELVAQDGLGEPVQLQPAVDAGQTVAADPPKTAMRRHRIGYRCGQSLQFGGQL